MKLDRELLQNLEWWTKNRERIYAELNRPDVQKAIEELRQLESSGELDQMQQGLKILKESGVFVDDEVKVDNDTKPRIPIDPPPLILLPRDEKNQAKIKKQESDLNKMRGKKVSKERLAHYQEFSDLLKAQQTRGEEQNVAQVSRTMQRNHKWTEKERSNFVRAFMKIQPKLQSHGI